MLFQCPSKKDGKILTALKKHNLSRKNPDNDEKGKMNSSPLRCYATFEFF